MTKLLLFLSIITFIIHVITVNIFTGSSSEISQLRNKIDLLRTQNKDLRYNLLEKTSLAKIYEKSLNLNLVSAKIIYEKSAQSVASAYGKF